jgi:hypothetical protein
VRTTIVVGVDRMETFTDMPDYPLVGSAFYCKSREEYELESIEGKSGYFFCDGYVDYAAACDANNPESCNNEHAITMFNNFQRVLNLYDCSRYSQLWTCANCTDAYKRWLCSHVYKKFWLPDTQTVESGNVNGGESPGAYQISCPFPETSLKDAEQRAEKGKEKPHYVKICSGMPKDPSTGMPYSAETLSVSPKKACGNDKGGCQGNIFLDPASASSVDEFYVGAIIEITPDSGPAAGQWAVIEHYDAFNRLAMFSTWKKGANADSAELHTPKQTDKYTIYLTKKQLGFCRDAKNPKKRAGKPCELTDKYPTLKYLPNSYAGGTRCSEDDQCVPIPINKSAVTIWNDLHEHQAPDLGYTCCPRTGPKLIPLGTAEDWAVYSHFAGTKAEAENAEAAGSSGEAAGNGVCLLQSASTKAYADASEKTFSNAATAGLSGIDNSGCIFNFTRSRDYAQDFCALRTCFPVCYDVVRRCPTAIEFNCPPLHDRREYDHSVCNVCLAHGCSMVVLSNTVDAAKNKNDPGSITCTDLNVDGYGPHPSLGHNVLGLPPGASCVDKTVFVGLVRDEPPLPKVPEGEKAPPNQYWEHTAASGMRMFALSGDKSNIVCKAP